MMVGNFVEQAQRHVGTLLGVEELMLETDAGFSWRDEIVSETALEMRCSRKRRSNSDANTNACSQRTTDSSV